MRVFRYIASSSTWYYSTFIYYCQCFYLRFKLQAPCFTTNTQEYHSPLQESVLNTATAKRFCFVGVPFLSILTVLWSMTRINRQTPLQLRENVHVIQYSLGESNHGNEFKWKVPAKQLTPALTYFGCYVHNVKRTPKWNFFFLIRTYF